MKNQIAITLTLLSLTLSACGKAKPATCAYGDLDCYFDHVTFKDQDGAAMSWTVVSTDSVPVATVTSATSATPNSSGTVTEGSTATIACEGSNQITAILDSTYSPKTAPITSSCGTRSCDALKSCIGKSSCSFSATNSACGGDPCVGSTKQVKYAVSCGTAPRITESTKTLTVTDKDTDFPVSLKWSDPNKCAPAMCVKFCAHGVCTSRTGCFGGARDGLTAGNWNSKVSFSATAEYVDDDFFAELTPVSSPSKDCADVAAVLDGAKAGTEVGASASIGMIVRAPQSETSTTPTTTQDSGCSTAIRYGNNCGNSYWGNHQGEYAPSNPNVSCSSQVGAGAVCGIPSSGTFYACPSGLTCTVACGSSGYPTTATCQ